MVSDPNVQQEARYDSTASRGSHVRTQDVNIQVVLDVIPLERLTLRRDRTLVSEYMDITQHHQCERIQSPYTRRNIPDDSSDEHGSFREHGYYNERGRPLGETRYPNRGRRPPRREESPDAGRPPDGGRPPDAGRPPDGEDHQMEEDHLMEEGPLMMEDCLMEMEDPCNVLIEEDLQD